MDVILKYFPGLTQNQISSFTRLPELYKFWNAQINVVSRKDIDNIVVNHILHSLAIAKYVSFVNATTVLDVGTGGGFPGIPLAIMFPECTFHCVDSIGKKIKVVNEISNALKLKNITSSHTRVEEIDGRYDFVTGRAVTALADFYTLVKPKIHKNHRNLLRNGVLYLAGGELQGEIEKLNAATKIYPLRDVFDEPYFETKLLVHIAADI